jgi:hypothetical protein
VHDTRNFGCRDRRDCRADGCCVTHGAEVHVVRKRDAGRKRGVAAAKAMRRRRTALDGAIVAV